MATENITNPSPEQIQEWKDKFETIYCLTVDEETDIIDDPKYKEKDDVEGMGPLKIEVIIRPGKKCWLRTPSRKILEYCQMASKNGSQMKFNEILLNGCWLGGDTAIKTNDVLFISVGHQLAELIEIKESKLEKI
jgi:hypothetical protein